VRDEAFAELDVGAGDDFLQLGLRCATFQNTRGLSEVL
jgi:hypothetical protein